MGKERIFLQEVASAKKFLLEIDDRLLFEKSKGDANIPLYLLR
jgi:hypothetical protein